MSTLNLENIKHPDSASNNISVDSSGNTSVNGSVGLGGASTSSYLQGVVGGKTVTIGSASEASSTLVLKDDDGVFDLATTGGTFRVYDDGTERMRIDSAGRVTMPSQPYARASCNVTGTGKIPLNAYNAVRGGMSIDNTNQRIIVPVSGAYIIGYNHLGNAGSGSCSMNIRVNGTTISPSAAQDIGNGNDNFGFQTIYQLAANDYIEFQVFAGATHGNADYNIMYAYLFG